MTNSSTPEFSQQSRKTLATQKSMFPKVESIISEKFSKQDSFSGKACQLVQTFRQLLPTNYHFESNVWPSLSSDDISKEVKQKNKTYDAAAAVAMVGREKFTLDSQMFGRFPPSKNKTSSFRSKLRSTVVGFVRQLEKLRGLNFFFLQKNLTGAEACWWTLVRFASLSDTESYSPLLILTFLKRERTRERESGCAWWMSMQRRLEKSNKSRRERNREAEKLF